MITVGLTGGIACGKSSVSRELAELGASIIDVDQVARELQAPGSPALREIARAFGPGVILGDGSLDRKGLGRIVFGDEEKLRMLDEIMFPRLFHRVEGIIHRFRHEGDEKGSLCVLVIDAAILFEAGMDRLVEKVIVVYADEETRIRRLMERDGISRDDALMRINAQVPLAEKVKRADFVIDNSGSRQATRMQVEAVFGLLVPGATSDRAAPDFCRGR